MAFTHEPVLLNEVLEWLQIKENDNVIDGTLGGGGHSFEMLKRSSPKGKLWGFDQDVNAIAAAGERLKEFKDRYYLINQNFKNINQINYDDFRALAPNRISAILVDCGVSSFQFSEEDSRGFSFGHNAELDMRFGNFSETTAATILNEESESYLTTIFRDYGEERHAKMYAQRIVDFRRNHDLTTVEELLEALKMPKILGRKHPATKVFQALRMAVNDELGAISEGLPELAKNLIAGGRMAVISFHSVEDRVMKQTMLKLCASGQFRLLTKHVIKPLRAEVLKNKRSRSAKMRVIEKI